MIPRLRHSTESAEAAHLAGHEVILHQPMEPEPGDANPGDGALLVGMGRRQVAKLLAENLDDVPHAVGLNNHMGSRATADEELMDAVLGAVRAELDGVYDSRIFISGFVTNAVVAVLLTFIGDRLSLDLYLVALINFGFRIFNNVALIRRHFI